MQDQIKIRRRLRLAAGVSKLATALDCSTEFVTNAAKDCGLECSECVDARKNLHLKLDHKLDILNRMMERMK